MKPMLEPIDHPSFANACARYFAQITEGLTDAMRAKGYPQAQVDIDFRSELHSLGGGAVIHLRTVSWNDRGPSAFPSYPHDGASLYERDGHTLAELIAQARALIAAMPDVTGYAADFGAVA